jgi:NADH:ubiquinone oxidoreductase subunit 6 (subunit J)
MFTNFGPPFIFVAVLLLVALVGAIILARQEDAD